MTVFAVPSNKPGKGIFPLLLQNGWDDWDEMTLFTLRPIAINRNSAVSALTAKNNPIPKSSKNDPQHTFRVEKLSDMLFG